MNKALVAIILSFFCAATTMLVLQPNACANYYKYTDGSGSVVITNNKASVPAKYRGSMKVITDEALSKKDTGAKAPQQQEPEPVEAASAKAQAPAPAAVPEGRFAQLAARYPWFKPLVYIVGFLAALIAVIKVASLLPNPLMSRTLWLTFFLGTIVFVYKSYVDYVANTYSSIKTETVKTLENSNQKEQQQLRQQLGEKAPAQEGAAK